MAKGNVRTKFINTGHLDSRKLQKGRHDTRGHLLDTATVDKKRTRVPASVGWGIGSGYGSGFVDWKITCAKTILKRRKPIPDLLQRTSKDSSAWKAWRAEYDFQRFKGVTYGGASELLWNQ